MTSMFFFFSGVTSREVGLVSHDDLLNIFQTNCLTVNGKCVMIFLKHVYVCILLIGYHQNLL